MSKGSKAEVAAATDRLNVAMEAARRELEWTYGDGAIHLHHGFSWEDPMVRVEARMNARILARALCRPIQIEDAEDRVVDTVEVPGA